jgi:hypothetical protein
MTGGSKVRAARSSLDDLPGAEIFFVRVGSDEVEVELVGLSLGEEVAAALERFQVEELVFLEAVNGFDVALVGVSGGPSARILRAGRRLGLMHFNFTRGLRCE